MREQGHRLELACMLELGHMREQVLGRMLEQGLVHRRGLELGRIWASRARGMGLPHI